MYLLYSVNWSFLLLDPPGHAAQGCKCRARVNLCKCCRMCRIWAPGKQQTPETAGLAIPSSGQDESWVLNSAVSMESWDWLLDYQWSATVISVPMTHMILSCQRQDILHLGYCHYVDMSLLLMVVRDRRNVCDFFQEQSQESEFVYFGC